jgi:putative peptidoglycan lipid II flippase
LQVRIRIASRRARPDRVASSLPDQHFDAPEVTEGPAGPSSAKPSIGADANPPKRVPAASGGAASRVALGILISRLTGLVRERVIAHYFGDSAVADAFRAAIRIPNLLNNLFGEGVLSASFVTVYSKLRAQGREKEAEQVADAVFGILSLVCSLLVLAGVLTTPWLIDIIAPGFAGDKRDLTIRLVRILFPGTGLLALSAWCLGVLNSHRHFLLSYTAPVALNLTMIAALVSFGAYSAPPLLAVYLAWASVAGSALQFLVQLPRVLQLLPDFVPSLNIVLPGVQTVLKNFGPVFLSRGVVQVSSYIDSVIASLLPTGAVAALGYGQTISILPVSLFSMSISAAELPSLSGAVGNEGEVAEFLRKRLVAGLRRIAFLVIPSAVAFLVLGDIVAGALYQTGRFNRADSVYVWAVLAGSAVGLLATSLGRLYSSAFYALLDTKTPLRFAVIRVALTTILGLIAALWLPGALSLDRKWGVAGLTMSAGVAGWVEFSLLRFSLAKRIGSVSIPVALLAKLWTVAFFASFLAYGIKRAVGTNHPLPLAVTALSIYGVVYWLGTSALGVAESKEIAAGVFRRLWR